MNNLNLPQVASNQNQKEVTINDQAMALDAAFSETLVVDMSAGDVSLSQEQFTRNFLFQCSGNSVARTVTVYAGVKRLFAVENQGSAAITVTAAGATVTVPASNVAILHCDGTDVRVASSGALSGIASVVAGDGISVDVTDPTNPIVAANVQNAPLGPHVRDDGDWTKLVAGSNVTFDDSTPGQIEVSASGSGGGRWPPFQPPAASSFATVTGGSTVFSLTDDDDVGLQFAVQASSGATLDHLAYRTLTDKSQDWDLIARITTMLDATNYSGVGLGIMDSVGGRITHYTLDARAALYISRMASVSAWNADIRTTVFRWAPRWLRISLSGSTLVFSVSADGKTWHEYYSESVTTYLANRPDRIGLVAMTGRTIPSEFSCDYFSLTGAAV